MLPDRPSDFYKQNADGDISFFMRSATKEFVVKIDRAALNELASVSPDLKTLMRVFETYRDLFEGMAWDKHFKTQADMVEISADDFLLARRILQGMCVV